MIGRNDPCWCGSGKKWKNCHFPEKSAKNHLHISKNQTQHELYYRKHNILIKDSHQILGIREACRLASHILDETCHLAKAGVTTLELNDFAHKMHVDAGAIPAVEHGNPPFPKAFALR